jgi:hypothetical protein
MRLCVSCCDICVQRANAAACLTQFLSDGTEDTLGAHISSIVAALVPLICIQPPAPQLVQELIIPCISILAINISSAALCVHSHVLIPALLDIIENGTQLTLRTLALECASAVVEAMAAQGDSLCLDHVQRLLTVNRGWIGALPHSHVAYALQSFARLASAAPMDLITASLPDVMAALKRLIDHEFALRCDNQACQDLEHHHHDPPHDVSLVAEGEGVQEGEGDRSDDGEGETDGHEGGGGTGCRDDHHATESRVTDVMYLMGTLIDEVGAVSFVPYLATALDCLEASQRHGLLMEELDNFEDGDHEAGGVLLSALDAGAKLHVAVESFKTTDRDTYVLTQRRLVMCLFDLAQMLGDRIESAASPDTGMYLLAAIGQALEQMFSSWESLRPLAANRIVTDDTFVAVASLMLRMLVHYDEHTLADYDEDTDEPDTESELQHSPDSISYDLSDVICGIAKALGPEVWTMVLMDPSVRESLNFLVSSAQRLSRRSAIFCYADAIDQGGDSEPLLRALPDVLPFVAACAREDDDELRQAVRFLLLRCACLSAVFCLFRSLDNDDALIGIDMFDVCVRARATGCLCLGCFGATLVAPAIGPTY